MKEYRQESRTKLLNCAKEEFLAMGFEKASLRRICQKAGVTTGAVYFFFRNKEDLFCQIVSDTAKELSALGNALLEREFHEPETGADCDARLMEFLYRRKDEILLLLEKSAGTRYASYSEELYGQMRKMFFLFFQRFGNRAENPELIRILVEMRMKGFLELLKGDYTMEQILRLAQQIGIYADGGFRQLTAGQNQVTDMEN